MKLYAYILADGTGRSERVDCGFPTHSALWLWTEHGYLPEIGFWE